MNDAAKTKKQLDFERLIADLASKLVYISPEQLEEVIDSTLRALGRFLHTERAFFARYSEDDKSLNFTNMWAAEGISLASNVFAINLAAEIPWVAQQIRNGEVINLGPGLSGMPDEAKKLREYLERDGIKSGLVVPVRVEGRSIGLLGLDTVIQPRKYPQSIVDRLKIVADMIGTTLHRVIVQEKLEQYRHIVESTTSPVGLVDRNYVYQYVNNAYCSAFKKSRNDIIGGTGADLFGQEIFNTILKPQYDRCFAGEEVTFRSWFDLPGWQNRFMDVLYSPFLSSDGEVSAVVVNVHDITDVKQIELKLKESEGRFRAFMDNIPAAIYVKDKNDRHIYGNPAAHRSVGKNPDEFIGSTTRDFWPPEVAGRLIELDRKVIDEDIPRITEEWNNSEKGETRWRKDIKFPIKLETGKKLLGGIAIDITENKRAEQALAEQLGFEQLIADIAAQLAQSKPDQLEVSIDSTLQALGQFFGTQRAFFSQFTDDGKSLYHRIIWAAEGIDVPAFFFELDMAAASPWFAQQIRTGKIINTGPGLVNLPGESGDLPERLQREGINSGVVVPIRVEGRSVGMIGLDTVDQPREYSQAIEDRLRIIADMIGSTLKRVQAQETLRNSLKEVEQLKERLEQENIYLRKEIAVNYRHEEIIGKSKPVMEMLSRAEQVAETDSTVLILGETGTGKELLARTIHKYSTRKDRQMVKVNCAVLPATLIESELFGREKGAYTGAMTRQIGRFEIADGSTIFLDEIGELPFELQAKLLRVLQEGQFERLGSPRTISVDVRIIASTNRDLARAVMEGRFREDLYYRLNVFSITVPPLSDRVEDIPMLVWAFVKEFERSMGKSIERIPQKNMEALQRYPWPGNVRELRNVIEQAMIISQESTLIIQLPGTSEQARDLLLRDVERNHILKILRRTGWRIRGAHGAAELLGLKPTTLEARMKKLNLKRPK